MKWSLFQLIAGCMPAAVLAQAAFVEGQAELVKVVPIHRGDGHAAFTDLIRFDNQWLCCFRESDKHVGGADGVIRVFISSDGETWMEQATITQPGVDLRDPKLERMPDGRRLILTMGGSRYEGEVLQGRQPYVSTSQDGKSWTPPQKVLGEGDWLWRTSLNGSDSRLYGVAYNTYPNTGAPPSEEENSVKLFSSTDGLVWRLASVLEMTGRPNETTVRFLEDGRAVALMRREGGDRKGAVGVSAPPYRDWTWKALAVPLGGPNFVVLPDGSMVAGSRGFGKTPGAHMVLFKMTESGWDPILELPSGGDCSYPGMVWQDDELWVSYYSSHEGGQAGVYVARVKLNWVKP